MKEITYTIDEIEPIAQKLKSYMQSCDIITFQGPLGAGKTTLIRALADAYGVSDVVTSPTFSYMNIYSNKDGDQFVHFDLYRLANLDEFLAAGFDEYLHDAKVFIEWPEIIRPLLEKMNVCHIIIDYDGIDKRKLRIEKEVD